MNTLKILIAEDNKAVKALYDRFLPAERFDKKFVLSGREVLESYRLWRPDVLLLDIMLPEMSGYSVLKAIRTELRDKDTVIIMATGLGTAEDVRSCLELGIQGYIVKPFHPQSLADKILDYYRRAVRQNGTVLA